MTTPSRHRRLAAAALAALAAVVLPGCAGSDDPPDTTAAVTVVSTRVVTATVPPAPATRATTAASTAPAPTTPPQATATGDPGDVPTPATGGSPPTGARAQEACLRLEEVRDYVEGGAVVPEPVADGLLDALGEPPEEVAEALGVLIDPASQGARAAAWETVRGYAGPLCATSPGS